MKITREIIDNNKKIIHINYEDKDIEEAMKHIEDNTRREKTQEPNA